MYPNAVRFIERKKNANIHKNTSDPFLSYFFLHVKILHAGLKYEIMEGISSLRLKKWATTSKAKAKLRIVPALEIVARWWSDHDI